MSESREMRVLRRDSKEEKAIFPNLATNSPRQFENINRKQSKASKVKAKLEHEWKESKHLDGRKKRRLKARHRYEKRYSAVILHIV